MLKNQPVIYYIFQVCMRLILPVDYQCDIDFPEVISDHTNMN